MTEREFKQIGSNRIRLRQLEAMRESICASTGISAVQYGGMPNGSGDMVTGMPEIEHKVDIEREYKALLLETSALISRAKKRIRKIPDRYIRAVLGYKYVNGYDMVRIAGKVGLTRNQCEEICKVYFNNVF